MAQTTLMIGDIVKLKSGGPEMTITKIVSKIPKILNNPPREREINTIHTNWFDEKKLMFGEFKEPELVFIRNENDGFIG